MKKTDNLTLIGLGTGIVLLLWGMMMGGSSLKVFFDPASILITVGGSFCALLITYGIKEIKSVGTLFVQSTKESTNSNKELISKFVEFSKKSRKDGLLSLEDDIASLDDDFLKKGLQMVVDGIEPETIREIMELEIGEMEKRHSSGAAVLKTWSAYAPAFGMIGTLIGLIQMLSSNLSDAAGIASGMAKALITTFYGSLMANLVLTPMSINLSTKSEKESGTRDLMLEGILAIQSGVNPRIVEEKLVTYLEPKDKEEYLAQSISSGEGVRDNG
ncbi:motility protein A [Clostridium fallax]|uniref:Chemotaxis protein MotA n=1 Tax=Clostridium fallax TaxID=1533 RepID=A0A1M4UJJ7_9CLOT|nr:motility protein A [Clostridium fallax]SHE56828.1 chemotaxis protein MotA [Clostridium fallax]SQB07597.1 chemotaxis MotA protein [Clostridium fallax]